MILWGKFQENRGVWFNLISSLIGLQGPPGKECGGYGPEEAQQRAQHHVFSELPIVGIFQIAEPENRFCGE